MTLATTVRLLQPVQAGGPPSAKTGGPGSGHYARGPRKLSDDIAKKLADIEERYRPHTGYRKRDDTEQAEKARLQAVAAIPLYHGTTTDALKQIVAEGLVPGHSGGGDDYAKTTFFLDIPQRPPSVYVTPALESAEYMAHFVKLIHPGAEEVVMKWEVPKGAVPFIRDERMQEGLRTDKPLKPEWLAAYRVDHQPWSSDKDPEHIPVRPPDPYPATDTMKSLFGTADNTFTLYSAIVCLGGQ